MLLELENVTRWHGFLIVWRSHEDKYFFSHSSMVQWKITTK